MIKKIGVIFAITLIIAGVIFSIANVLTTNLDAEQTVTWEKLWEYHFGGHDYYFCNGDGNDCCIVTADAPKLDAPK